MNSALILPETSPGGTSAASTSKLARGFAHGARVLTGLLFLVTGLNGFLNLLPQPTTPMPEGALAFIGALVATGYMLPLIAGTQVFAGALLLANRFVPLALVVLAPFLVNAAAFHLFLEPSGRVMTAIVVALELYLAWVHRKAFAPLLAARMSAGR